MFRVITSLTVSVGLILLPVETALAASNSDEPPVHAAQLNLCANMAVVSITNATMGRLKVDSGLEASDFLIPGLPPANGGWMQPGEVFRATYYQSDHQAFRRTNFTIHSDETGDLASKDFGLHLQASRDPHPDGHTADIGAFASSMQKLAQILIAEFSEEWVEALKLTYDFFSTTFQTPPKEDPDYEFRHLSAWISEGADSDARTPSISGLTYTGASDDTEGVYDPETGNHVRKLVIIRPQSTRGPHSALVKEQTDPWAMCPTIMTVTVVDYCNWMEVKGKRVSEDCPEQPGHRR